MNQRDDLISYSLALLRSSQEPTGAFLACSRFPTYRYSWFRDGTFIAHALDLWGDHESAHRFYEWGVRVVAENAATVRAVLSAPAHQPPVRYLHTRYRADGSPGDDDWPNFQLDGFGTFLWGMAEHLDLTATPAAPAHWEESANLLVTYLQHLWRAPNYDCWEEFPDRVHIATLAAIFAGLRAASRRLGRQDAEEVADAVRSFVLDHLTGGALPKFLGSTNVDASLLWAALPFDLLPPDDGVMARTIDRVEQELLGPRGGVHRYADDSYYGGGAWILLTAALAECFVARGRMDRAEELCRWIEQQVDEQGNLPEQVPFDLPHPESYQHWVDTWGPIASPLLWSHASYLRLTHMMGASQRYDLAAS